MAKYKVGDKVRIKEDLEEGRSYNGYSVIASMLPYLGKEAVIRIANEVYYNINIDDGMHRWTEEMLEDIPAAEKSEEASILFLDENDVSDYPSELPVKPSHRDMFVNALIDKIREIDDDDDIACLMVGIRCTICPLYRNICDANRSKPCREVLEEWLKG